MIWLRKGFKKNFDGNFWKAFKKFFSIYYRDILDKDLVIDELYDNILSRNYYPSIPKEIIYVNKWKWVVRKTTLFELKDYLLYFIVLNR